MKEQELVQAIKDIRAAHPDYGDSKLISALRKKFPNTEIHARKVLKVIKKNNLSLPSQEQAKEDETSLDFQLLPEELEQNPDELFELLEQRGQGTYGSVYKALHRRTGQIVAIKQVLYNKNDAKNIMREIDMMKALDHPNIVKFFGHFIYENFLWIVMEYCGVGSVSDILSVANCGLLEVQIARIIRDSLRGLAYLHTRGFIHRDIKAGNIVINTEGIAKLVDFGVAGQITSTTLKRNTLIGTPYWMAPEVIMEEGHDTQADIWSIGITAIEMAEGAPPFSGLRPMIAMFRVPSLPPPTLKSPKNFSPTFNEFISLCLMKDPSKRPSSTELLKHPFVKVVKKPRILQNVVNMTLDYVNAGRLDRLDNNKEEEETFRTISTAGQVNSGNHFNHRETREGPFEKNDTFNDTVRYFKTISVDDKNSDGKEKEKEKETREKEKEKEKDTKEQKKKKKISVNVQ